MTLKNASSDLKTSLSHCKSTGRSHFGKLTPRPTALGAWTVLAVVRPLEHYESVTESVMLELSSGWNQKSVATIAKDCL